MDKRRKVKIAVGAVAALVLAIAVGAAGAVAGSRVLSADDESRAVIEDAAGQLGVEPEALSSALKQALENRVDEAVEDGRLTEEQGERLKERLRSADTPLLFGGFGPRGLGHPGVGHGASLDAAATYLDLTGAELRERLRQGNTLAEVARAEGKSVDGLVDALVEAAAERIDEAVENGRLTEERASELEADLEERIADLVNGELRGFPHRFGPGRWHGFQGEPRAFHGPRA